MRAIAPDIVISDELERAILRALEKPVEARHQSMRELAAALQQAPEGRVAAPLAGMLPLPEVTVGSFRPARASAAATSPQFDRLDPLPFDLVGRNGGGREGSRASSTLINGSGVATNASDDEPFPGRPVSRQRVKMAIWIAASLALGAAAVVYRVSSVDRAARVAAAHGPDASGRPSRGAAFTRDTRAPSAEGRAAEAASAAAVASVSAGSQPNSGNGTPASSGAEPSKAVVLNVQSSLPGATVSKDGFQVCDQTPCSVEVPRGAAVELVGVKGYARGVAKVLAQQDQTVNIVLVYPKGGGKKKDSGKPGLCEVTVDGLKILRPCE